MLGRFERRTLKIKKKKTVEKSIFGATYTK